MKRCTSILGTLLPALVLSCLGALPLAAGEQCELEMEVCVQDLIAHLEQRGWVGIELETEHEDGILVTRVVPDSPAERAGLEPGDLLRAMNGVAYQRKNKPELKKMYDAMVPGGKVTYSVARGGDDLEVTVTLGEMPESVIATWVGYHVMSYHHDTLVAEADSDDDDGPDE